MTRLYQSKLIEYGFLVDGAFPEVDGGTRSNSSQFGDGGWYQLVQPGQPSHCQRALCGMEPIGGLCSDVLSVWRI